MHAMLLRRRSGHYSQAVTDTDGHMRWHATNAGSGLREREGRRKNSIPATVYSCHNYSPPLSTQTHTSPQSHQANASASEDPA